MPHAGKLKFSNQEKSFVIEKIVEQKDIIESEGKSFDSSVARKKCFELITREFNEEFPDRKREEAQIKDFWRRSKIGARKEQTRVKRSAKQTGGGAQEETLSHTSELVLSVMGNKNDPLDNPYDDDAGEENDQGNNQRHKYTLRSSLRKDIWPFRNFSRKHDNKLNLGES